MDDNLVKQAEWDVRSGVRAVQAGRLQGEVKVVHWATIREVMERTIAKLRQDIERRSKELARPRPTAAVSGGADLESRVRQLEEELAAARERVRTLEDALDFLDLVDDFDVESFNAACEQLRARAGEVEQRYSSKAGEGLGVAVALDDMIEQGRRNREELYELRAEVMEGRGDLTVVTGMIRLSKEGEFLWRRLRLMKRWTERVAKAL